MNFLETKEATLSEAKMPKRSEGMNCNSVVFCTF